MPAPEGHGGPVTRGRAAERCSAADSSALKGPRQSRGELGPGPHVRGAGGALRPPKRGELRLHNSQGAAAELGSRREHGVSGPERAETAISNVRRTAALCWWARVCF